jgi:ComF family protein
MPSVVRESACTHCGTPFGTLTCTECWNRTFSFEAARCFGSLERPLSRALTLYKDSGERRLAAVFASMLVETLGSWSVWADAVVAVPASDAAKIRRGFDHMALIASGVAEAWSVPLIPALIVRTAADQRRLGRDARRANAATALHRADGVAVPRRIVLLDDVITTASTVDAASSALLNAGAAEVRVGALARAW